MLARDARKPGYHRRGPRRTRAGRRLRELGWKIAAVVTRSEPTARKATRYIGGGHAHAVISRRVLAAHVTLITVPDAAVEKVARELARIGAEELRGKIVLHT